MKRFAVLLLLCATLSPALCPAGEIDFIEDFSLSKDRTEALKQLIPGTENYYYYHCLHYQNTEQFDKVDEMLKAWVKRYNYTARVHEIQNRQALLTYEKNHRASLEFIRNRLGIQFNHQREIIGQKPNLPTKLDPKQISRETLTQRAMRSYTNLSGFEDIALDWLIASELTPDRRRALLKRLQRPDFPQLAKLVVDDLNYKYSSGFGSMNIHRQLLLVQLDEVLKRKPDLRNNNNFVYAYLSKLHPNDDVDWLNDAEQHQAYLNRLWTFVEKLGPVHNSLKAHVVYRRLELDRSHGIYDKDRFMTYIKLPRQVGYINRDYMKLDSNRRYPCNLNQNFGPVTLLPPVGNDEQLVRSYLHHFFIKETTRKPYEAYIDNTYLQHTFAETKIVNGLGEPEQWYSLLPPAMYQALKERIDLEFAPTSKKIFAREDVVALDLNVKNVKTLIVKVYEINTDNYYRENLSEVNTNINLDGLVANVEKTFTYAEPPLRRVGRHFDFPSVKKPGVYVIDFIGNGKSSRVVVRKGKLRYLARNSTAGHIFTVLDENNQRVPKATLWMAGTLYKPDEDGNIAVPYSNSPGRQAMILSHNGLSSLAYFDHSAENYSLSAGIFVDRQSLLKRKQATVMVRPGLQLSGTPVTLSVLEDVKLVITSIDHAGVATTKEIDDFQIFEDGESVFEFQVPERLSQINFRLSAKVQSLSLNKKIDLSASQNFTLNQIDRTEKVEDLHFASTAAGYYIDLLGKTGEPKSDRAVRLAIKHRDFRNPVNVTLQTDGNGRVTLGNLVDIASITATGPEGTAKTWPLLSDRNTYHQTMHGIAGKTIQLPYLGNEKKPAHDQLSLLELRGGTFLADRFKSMSIRDGMLQIGDLPRGDYDLLLRRSGRRIRLRLTAGEQNGQYVLGENRHLEVRDENPLQIDGIDTGKENLTVQLTNASKYSRVHVFATRYQPAFASYDYLSRVRDVEPYAISVPKFPSLYIEGRNIGDEYRYIIDRKYASKLPGNMLQRPSLLLNPWAIRKTETGQQLAQAGSDFGARPDPKKPARGRSPGEAKTAGSSGDFANLEFLADASSLVLNLKPDAEGVVTIDRKTLGSNQHLHIVAVDPDSTTYRTISLPETKVDYADLRLLAGLDPKQHFTQQKQISVVPAKGKFELADITTTRFESYDRLSRVYTLYATLSGDAKLIEFNFILNWHKMKPEEKWEKYSKYACHELNFFLYKKDPKFFKEVVQPFLRNKMHKTFMDQWLLGEKMSPYMTPWKHAQLNVVERILLSQRIAKEPQFTSRHVKDLYDLIPPNIDRYNFLFNTAVKGSALETHDGLGFDDAKKDARRKNLLSRTENGIRADMPAAPHPSMDDSAIAGPGGRPNGYALKEQRKMMEKLEKESAESRTFASDKNKKSDSKYAGKANRRQRFSDEADADGERAAGAFFGRDAQLRKKARQLYRKLDKTMEWVENNYYKLPIEQQNAQLVTVNAFWNDYARHDVRQPFYSTNLAESSRNFTEMMFALSLLDIPVEADDHDTKFDGAKMTLTAGSPMVVYHEEIREAKEIAENTPILVSQNFFRHGDRYRYENNERLDKYVRDEFLMHTVYGCQIVVTNPTSAPQKLDLLLQIPVGAMPVLNSQITRNVHLNLQPYNTQTIEYNFYFPVDGEYQHYPVHVSKNEQLLAHAEPVTLKVVEKLSRIDRESWDYVSQNGTPDDVLKYMKQHNLNRTNLDKIAFRMGDVEFFQTVTGVLVQRHVYNHTLWSYGIKHDSVPQIRQYLQHSNSFVNQSGAYIDSPILTIDPVVRKSYQHMDYRPLVNARAHQLGRRRQILNDRFDQQYHRLLKVLSYRRDLGDEDLMSVTYYMLLQDRAEEAMGFYGRVNSENLAAQMQYDYFTAYLDFYSDEQELARDIVEKYADHPVDRWRNAFASVKVQLDEIDGKAFEIVDDKDRTQKQTGLATSQPNFEFHVESKKVRVDYQNLKQVKVNYYLMDIELLFSRNPFVQQYSGQFSHIRPNATQIVDLADDKATLVFDLPKDLHTSNVLVEIIGGGQTKTQAYYANSLKVQMVENYGHLRVTSSTPGKPLSKVYVKVYAQMKDGKLRFYKDGYTDLRGRFDYTSLNTNELDFVSKFSVLVLSDEYGAVVREASPPKR